MAYEQYFFSNSPTGFTSYQPIKIYNEDIKLSSSLPLMEDITFDRGFDRITSSGIPIARETESKKDTFENIFDYSPQQGEPTQTYNMEELKSDGGLGINLMNSLIKKGNLKPYQAAAIVGHMTAESGLQSGKSNLNDLGKVSGGLGQWRDDRLKKLKEFAKSQGKAWTNPDVQVDFLLKEGESSEKKAFDKLRQSKDEKEASKAWSHYERFAGYDGTLATARTFQKSKKWSDEQTQKWIDEQHQKRENNTQKLYNTWKALQTNV